MTIDWDKPLQTMEGYDVALLTKEFMYAGEPVCCVMIESVCGYSRVFLYRENGSPVTLSSPSIRNKTKKVTKWYNLYADKPGLMYMDNEEMARKSTLHGKLPLATLSFEMEVPCD